jgi:hypothetical protein
MTRVQVPDLWCRRCGEPVRLDGGTGLPGELRKAVHAGTGTETGAGGHLAAPAELTIGEVRARHPERVIRRDGLARVSVDPAGHLPPARPGRAGFPGVRFGEVAAR